MADKPTEAQIEQALESAAAKSKPSDLEKLDRQFAAKLARVEKQKDVPRMLVEHLRVLWEMLRAHDTLVPWTTKAFIMAALAYFVSPLDVVPDWAPLGYVDDAVVVAVVHRRLKKEIEAFHRAQG